jgi:hypothetical protein
MPNALKDPPTARRPASLVAQIHVQLGIDIATAMLMTFAAALVLIYAAMSNSQMAGRTLELMTAC